MLLDIAVIILLLLCAGYGWRIRPMAHLGRLVILGASLVLAVLVGYWVTVFAMDTLGGSYVATLVTVFLIAWALLYLGMVLLLSRVFSMSQVEGSPEEFGTCLFGAVLGALRGAIVMYALVVVCVASWPPLVGVEPKPWHGQVWKVATNHNFIQAQAKKLDRLFEWDESTNDDEDE